MAQKSCEGSLHPRPEGRGIRDPPHSRCNKLKDLGRIPGIGNPWVYNAVEQISDEICTYKEERQYQECTLHHRIISGYDSIVYECAHAVLGVDYLDYQSPADHKTEVKGHDAYELWQHIPDHVLKLNNPVRQALGSRHEYEVLSKDLRN